VCECGGWGFVGSSLFVFFFGWFVVGFFFFLRFVDFVVFFVFWLVLMVVWGWSFFLGLVDRGWVCGWVFLCRVVVLCLVVWVVVFFFFFIWFCFFFLGLCGGVLFFFGFVWLFFLFFLFRIDLYLSPSTLIV